MPGRREFLRSTIALLAARALAEAVEAAPARASANKPSRTLPPWEPGVLEIHHIATGRGNSTLVIGPDGTTLLVDAGEAHGAANSMPPPLPNATLPAGQWIARYVGRQMDRIGQSGLNLFLLSNLCADRVGDVAPSSPQSTLGDYKLTGAASVAEALEVDEIIDRGWPDYNFPAPAPDPAALNYIALARSQAELGTTIQRAQPGSSRQLALRVRPDLYPQFEARVLAANGNVWTGSGETFQAHFPPLKGLSASELPSEPICSIAVHLRFGRFRYYAGSGLTCSTVEGQLPWRDIETPVAQVAGPVAAAQADHDGDRGGCGPDAVRALRPRAWVIPTWRVSQPAASVLQNLLSRDLYAGERFVFALDATPTASERTDSPADRLTSDAGHVVLRVPIEGRTFTVYVLNAGDEVGTVKALWGPFPAGSLA
jgi:hypothetical protein